MSLHVNLEAGGVSWPAARMKGRLWGQKRLILSVLQNQSGKLISEFFQSVHIDQTSPGGRSLVTHPGRYQK